MWIEYRFDLNNIYCDLYVTCKIDRERKKEGKINYLRDKGWAAQLLGFLVGRNIPPPPPPPQLCSSTTLLLWKRVDLRKSFIPEKFLRKSTKQTKLYLSIPAENVDPIMETCCWGLMDRFWHSWFFLLGIGSSESETFSIGSCWAGYSRLALTLGRTRILAFMMKFCNLTTPSKTLKTDFILFFLCN